MIHRHSRTGGHAYDLRKRSSAPLAPMPSKLVMRVRFPSPALRDCSVAPGYQQFPLDPQRPGSRPG